MLGYKAVSGRIPLSGGEENNWLYLQVTLFRIIMHEWSVCGILWMMFIRSGEEQQEAEEAQLYYTAVLDSKPTAL